LIALVFHIWERYIVSSKNGDKITCRKVIITAAVKAIRFSFGWQCVRHCPAVRAHDRRTCSSAVPLVVKDSLCHYLQGQRIIAGASSIIAGKKSAEVRGELLFTNMGFPYLLLDISEEISIALNRHHQKDVLIAFDMVPFWTKNS